MRITPERSRKIFSNPSPPNTVWEKQFDYFNDELKKIAKQDWKDINDNDLWYYFHDLSYVDLQPELFNYLFPVCLNFWYKSLMKNESSEQGDSEFHYSLYHGNIIEKMLSENQRQEIFKFFHDGFIDRIEMERGFQYCGTSTPAYAWFNRFNSLGFIAPVIENIWSTWWRLDHPGKAVSAIMYASGLIYLKGENPIFGEWTPEKGGGGPYLTESDTSIYDDGWLGENVSFLNEKLSVEYIQKKVEYAAIQLSSEPEAKIAKKIANDALKKNDIIQIKIEDLIENLSKPNLGDSWDA